MNQTQIPVELHENNDFNASFTSSFGELVRHIECGTLKSLPKVSEGLLKWKKWAEEEDDEQNI